MLGIVIFNLIYIILTFLEHLHRQLLPDRILSAYLLPSANADRHWNMKRKMRPRKFQLRSRKHMSLFRISLFPNHPMAMSVPVFYFKTPLTHSFILIRTGSSGCRATSSLTRSHFILTHTLVQKMRMKMLTSLKIYVRKA